MHDDAHPSRETTTRKSLLFFASADTSDITNRACQLYLDHLIQSSRFDITVMVPNGLPFSSYARQKDVSLLPISDFSRNLLRRAPQLWPILTAMRRYRFDVALTHEGFACRGLKQISKQVTGVCHNDHFAPFAAADKVIALTSGAAEQAKETLGEDVDLEILPYPYKSRTDRSVAEPSDDASFTIGTSGDFVEEDGLGIFIHAAQLLHQSRPDVNFVIAGSGPMEHELKELADQIAPFVDFTGSMTAEELAGKIDLYCLTSPYSPFSFSLCEMMDSGVACVATCANGPMDILKGGMVGPLVPQNDAFMLALELQELLEDPAKVARIRTACQERIGEEDFWPCIFEQRLVDILTSAIRRQ